MPPKQRRVDLYDERNIQSHALERWERQKKAWEKMSNNLKSLTISSNRRSVVRPPKFPVIGAQARERQEDLGLIHSSVPQSVLSSYYTWESMLRTTNEGDAVRHVQIGKGYYPYALFGEVRDPTALKSNHPVYTRMIHDGYADDVSEATNERTTARQSVLKTLQAGSDGELLNQLVADQKAEEMMVTSTNRLATASYYEQRLHTFAPFIQKRFSHFLLPRQALSVRGRKLNIGYADGDGEDGEHDVIDPEPVQSFPPPPPQMVCLPAPSHNGVIRKPSESLRGAPLNSPSTPGSNRKAVEDLSSFGGMSADDDEGLLDSQSPSLQGEKKPDGPSLVLSTQRLLFHARPGELTHGHIVIDNNSPVTVYYTWVPVDAVSESLHLQQPAGEGEDHHDDEGNDEDLDSSYAGPGVATVGRTLHRLARNSAQSKNFFRMSAPVNGVVLPEEQSIFPFSVRSPYAGRFSASYELLTVPPSPDRIIVELTAIVKLAETSARSLARPVEEVLSAKVAGNEFRHQVQRIIRNPDPYDAADIDAAISAIHQAEADAEQAEAAKRDAQRDAWKVSNMHTYDGIPYNMAVYDKLLRLREELSRTMRELDCPLHQTEWNSSLNELLGDICVLRDAPARNTFYQAVMVLLRAARVSDSEDEPLDELLLRAAKMMVMQMNDRRLELYRAEVEILQLPREPVVPPQAAGAGGRKRSPSLSRNKHSAPSSGRDRNGAGSVPAIPVPGTFRAHLRSVPTSADEVDGLRVESDAMIDAFSKSLEAEQDSTVKAMAAQFRMDVIAGCDLPMLAVVQAARTEDIKTIQNCEQMEVDYNAETSIFKASGKKK